MNLKSRNVSRGIKFKLRRAICININLERGATNIELINEIISKNNLNEAYKKVVSNKGACGVDKITVDELGQYIKNNRNKIVNSIMIKQYYLMPVRRVYIPESNRDKRPLGIPTAVR